MKKIMQQAVSCGVIALFMLVLSPLATVCAASNYATGRERTNDSLTVYRANNRVGQFQDTALQGKIIVVDPGHGGSDTGAIGPHNSLEKQVTLTVAQELRRLLANEGATVIMTRSTDMDVSYSGTSDEEELDARVQIANRANADLFVSIHTDSCGSSSCGTTTYFSAAGGDNDQLARLVQENMVAELNLFDRGTQQRDYYVLDHTEMPAILTEIAFISNPQEEKLLTSRNFDRKAALGICEGITQYFQADNKK